MASNKKLLLIAALIGAFALPGCSKKRKPKKKPEKIERIDMRMARWPKI